MCIIVVKKSDVGLPSMEVLRTCFENNPHGVGYMFNDNGLVHIRKGFMTFSSFIKDIEYINKIYSLEDKNVVFHFRISTSGNVDKGNCHPYPITNSTRSLRTLRKDVKLAFCHNGIISQYNRKDKVLNDTQLFDIHVLHTFYRYDRKFYRKNEVMRMIEQLANSKLCFLNGDGEIFTIGHFYESEGLLFSNLSYKPIRTIKRNEYSYKQNRLF